MITHHENKWNLELRRHAVHCGFPERDLLLPGSHLHWIHSRVICTGCKNHDRSTIQGLSGARSMRLKSLKSESSSETWIYMCVCIDRYDDYIMAHFTFPIHSPSIIIRSVRKQGSIHDEIGNIASSHFPSLYRTPL